LLHESEASARDKVLHIDQEKHMVASMMDELLQKGIQAARSGNRLLARLHLERATESNLANPELWLWLSWVAESPAKSQVYLRKLSEFPEHATLASAGLEWLEALTEGFTSQSSHTETTEVASAGMVEFDVPSLNGQSTNGPLVPEALLNRAFIAPAPAPGLAPATPMSVDEFPVQCPACDVVLLARNSALGQTRSCPACQHRFVMLPKLQAPVVVGVPVGPTAVTETILIVDDSPTIRRVAATVLERNGYRVLTAESGEAGFDLALKERPNLILLDVRMPGVDGYETCKRLRAAPVTAKTPIVMLSGNDGFFDQVQGYQAGSSVYLTKPCEAKEMVAAVKRFLSQPTSSRN
jgi:CheY-like chemotaxis protein